MTPERGDRSFSSQQRREGSQPKDVSGPLLLDVLFDEVTTLCDRLGFDSALLELKNIPLKDSGVVKSLSKNRLRRSILGLDNIAKGFVVSDSAGLIVAMGIGNIRATTTDTIVGKGLFIGIVHPHPNNPEATLKPFEREPNSYDNLLRFLLLTTPHSAENSKAALPKTEEGPSVPKDSSLQFRYDFEPQRTSVVVRRQGKHITTLSRRLNKLFKSNELSNLSVKQDPLAPCLEMIKEAVESSQAAAKPLNIPDSQ